MICQELRRRFANLCPVIQPRSKSQAALELLKHMQIDKEFAFAKGDSDGAIPPI
jgi:hypothetical protein